MRQLLFSFFILVSVVGRAQQIDIDVTIKDSITNEPLPFVTVYLKRSGVGLTTNLSGEARISVMQSELKTDTLVCSYSSYEKKYIPISILQSRHLDVKLSPSYQNIEEVKIVVSKKVLTARQIIKKVLKNTDRNYANAPVNLKGLYRETFKEDNKAVYLNEATINIYYGKYPQGTFQRRDWEDWYYDDTYAFEYEFSLFNGFPNQFNSKDDRVQLIEARSTENWSKYGYKAPIIGGPLSLTSKDYLKYQSDFLDTKNFNKYAYEKAGIETVNGTVCYAIHFYPLETGRKMSISFGKKLNRSIYVGKMYVDRSSFAVVKMEFQLAKNVDFGYYTRFVPLDYTVEINYKEQNSIWSLNTIKLVQTRSLGKKMSDHKVFYESIQELFFTEVIADTVRQIPEELEWKHTRMTNLRNLELPYHSDYWDRYEAQEYIPLPKTISNDLTTKKRLKEQFRERFKQQSNLPLSKANPIDFTFKYPNDTLQDVYQWFFDESKSLEFYTYIEEENQYADNFILGSRNFQRKFFNSLYNFYPRDTAEVIETYKPGQIMLKEDSTENLVYYQFTDSINSISVFNRSKFESSRKNCFIDKIKFSKTKVGIRYTNSGGLTNSLIILNKGNLNVQDSIPEVDTYEWLNDSILYYSTYNSIKRSTKVYAKNLSSMENSLIKEELDSTFDITVSQSKSYLFYISDSFNETEIYALNKNVDTANFQLLVKRKKGVYNRIKEFGGSLYLLTNDDAVNNRILIYENESWQEVIPHSKNRLITNFIVTEDFIVLNSFKNSFQEVIYRPRNSKKWKTLEFPSDISDASIYNLKNNSIQIAYSSPQKTYTLYEFDLEKEKLKEVSAVKIKRQFELEPAGVKTERLWVKTEDGVKVPLTISRSKYPKKKHKGLILKAYGAYGAFPGGTAFSAQDLILMKDGFSIAYAHVRGGCLMGNQWYEDGKLLNKENTFNDYIACAEYLIKKEYTDADHLVGYGVSAGGMLMGVVLNRRPELFNTVILDHPHLDVLTTMMNDSLPLTTTHYKESGNPNIPEYYEYIKAYSPYQNCTQQDYPNVFFIASSNDFQTQTWQIAKYVARIRALNTSENVILFKTDIGSGHAGSTQDDQWIRDVAFMNAFIYHNLFK